MEVTTSALFSYTNYIPLPLWLQFRSRIPSITFQFIFSQYFRCRYFPFEFFSRRAQAEIGISRHHPRSWEEVRPPYRHPGWSPSTPSLILFWIIVFLNVFLLKIKMKCMRLFINNLSIYVCMYVCMYVCDDWIKLENKNFPRIISDNTSPRHFDKQTASSIVLLHQLPLPSKDNRNTSNLFNNSHPPNFSSIFRAPNSGSEHSPKTKSP